MTARCWVLVSGLLAAPALTAQDVVFDTSPDKQFSEFNEGPLTPVERGLKLSGPPGGSVTVDIVADPASALWVRDPALTFDGSTWDEFQTVRLMGLSIESTTDVTVSYSASWSDWTWSETVTVRDMETDPRADIEFDLSVPTSSCSHLTAMLGKNCVAMGESMDYGVRITSAPTEAVEVSLTPTNRRLTVDPPRLTIDSSNWNTYQTVTITGQPPISGDDYVYFHRPPHRIDFWLTETIYVSKPLDGGSPPAPDGDEDDDDGGGSPGGGSGGTPPPDEDDDDEEDDEEDDEDDDEEDDEDDDEEDDDERGGGGGGGGGPPRASIGTDADCAGALCRARTGARVSFRDASVGTVRTRRWDFGDGGRPRGASVSHSWSEPGFYEVTLWTSDGPVESTASLTFLVEASDPAGGCVANAETLCLQDSRYAVTVDWWREGGGYADHDHGVVVHAGTNDSGLFRFFGEDNWEVLIKVLDGCARNGHAWVFGASTTDLGYLIRVRDTVTGAVREYRNEPGVRAPAITDATAFPASCAR